MNKIVLALIFCFFSFSAFTQDYKFIYHLNENFASVKEKKAVITGKGYYENSGLFRLDAFEKKTGVLFIKAHFKDSSLTVLQGPYETFYLNGMKESEGFYENGLEQGPWLDWDSTGMKKDSVNYNKGVRTSWAHYVFYKKNKNPYSYEFTDSLKNTLMAVYYNEDATKSDEAIFVGNEGKLTVYKDGGVTTKDLHTREQKEAEFPGGMKEFSEYLRRNLRGSVATDGNAPVGIYRLNVKFIVDKEGNITDVKTENKAGYGMEEEALRVIRESPKWNPAIQYGFPVKAYRTQPIVFAVSKN